MEFYQPVLNGSYPLASGEGLGAGTFSALSVIVVSEIGDRTFFIAAVLALTNSAVGVFGGAISALALMTLLSAGLGLMFSFLSGLWVRFLSALLFLVFGLKMLREGYTMSSNAAKEELEEVQKAVDNKISGKTSGLSVDVESGVRPRMSSRWIFLEAFTMTFLSEWGDRSQIATVVLAAKHNVIGVVIGAVNGHAACTLLAVIGGRLIADRISIRKVTLIGGVLFLIFAVTSFVGALEEAVDQSRMELPSSR